MVNIKWFKNDNGKIGYGFSEDGKIYIPATVKDDGTIVYRTDITTIIKPALAASEQLEYMNTNGLDRVKSEDGKYVRIEFLRHLIHETEDMK